MSPLHMAAASGNPEAVQQILNQKPNLNARTEPNGFTPLHMCVSSISEDKDRQKAIKLLCDAGADIELKTYDKGLTPLQLAAMRGKSLCVKTLINCGANVHAKEGNGATALHGAAHFGYSSVVKILLEAGADAQAPDKHGNTPMKLANSHPKVTAILNTYISNACDAMSDSIHSDQKSDTDKTNSQKEVNHKPSEGKNSITDHSKTHKLWWKFW